MRLNPMGVAWSNFLVTVAENGRIVGCGQIKTHRDGAQELASVAVIETYRKKGIATQIIRQLLAKHDGPVWLMCESGLVPFYKPYGFEEIKDIQQMARYYRGVVRFVRFVSFIKKRDGVELAVMCWHSMP